MQFKFVMNSEQMILALNANEWREIWKDNWVKNTNNNPDFGGMSILDAFECLMKEKNLL